MVKRTSLAIFSLTVFLIIPFISLNSYAEELGVSSGVTTADPSSKGSAGISVPISIPSGRQGISPNLKLVYDSSHGYGWVGIGWDLSIGAIQRSMKRGVNYSTNDYVFVGNGVSSELVSRPDWGTNYYGAKIEGAFNKFYYNSSTGGWEVTDKTGTKYYYGRTSASRQNNPFDYSNANEIFKWLLDRVEDVNGNYMTVTYVKDKEVVYMDRIDYTGNSNGLSPTNYVKFNREDTILKNIEVYANGQLVRKCVLDYITSSNSGRPLLNSVQTYGSDGISALPATTFSYQTTTDGFDEANLVFSDSYNPGPIGVGDFNGDGKDDIILGGYVYLSSGNGFDQGSNWWNFFTHDFDHVNKIYTGDFNGDGKDDILVNATDSWDDTAFHVCYSNGFSFSYPVKLEIGGNPVVAVGDFDGDGKADIAVPGDGCRIYLSTDNGFREEWWSGFSYVWSIFDAYAKDLSGDGRADLVVEAPLNNNAGGFRIIYVNYSKGSTFTQEVGVDDSIGNLTVGDFNGDGRADIAGSPNTRKFVSTSRGIGFNGWSLWSEWSNSYLYTNGIYAGDFNGDGKDDLLVNGTDNEGYDKGIYVHYSTGTVADLLSTINNGIGGTTTISYKPSTQYSNTYMPFVIQTVSSITSNDGNGNISTTNFTYSGGYYDINEREFRGFNYVKSTNITGTTTETWFHQDNIYKGLPYEQIIKDVYGNIYTRSYNTYNSASPAAGVTFPYVSQEDDYVYDGTSTYKKSSTSFAYDSYGNITRKYSHGDVSLTGDEKDEYTEYTLDTATWHFLPSRTYLSDSTGTLKSDMWFAYDTKGNLLTKTSWLNGGTNNVVNHTYNEYGNQISVTDAKGNITTIGYDSTYTYPVAVTNALGHTATKTYDLRYGKVLTGTDANGNTMTYEYDVFGRIVKATNPLDIYSAYGTTSYFYENFGSVGNQRFTTYSTEHANTTAAQSNPTCPLGGTYNPNTNRCESAYTTQYQCSLTNQIYSTQTACANSCLQTANCSSQNVSLSGEIFTGYGEIKLIGSGNNLNYYSWDGDRYNYSGTITISGATVSGEVILNGGASGAPVAGKKVISSGNSLNFYWNDGDRDNYLGTINISGATVSGATVYLPWGFSFYGSGSSLVFKDAAADGPGDKTVAVITVTSTNYTCPLTGGCACSGNPSTCSAPSPESCSPANTCPNGYTLNGDVCVANHICPSGTSLNTATDMCEPNPTCPLGGTYNTSTNRCESAYATQYQCSLTNQIYSTQTACANSCLQTANCSLQNISLSGQADRVNSNSFIKAIGSGNSINFYMGIDDDGRWSEVYMGTITVSGATVSGGTAYGYPTYGAAMKVIGSGSSINFYAQGDSTDVLLGTITVSGATVSGGMTSYAIPPQIYGSNNNLVFYDPNGDHPEDRNLGTITFTPTNYTCPLTGGCACSGNPSTCSAPSPESCNPINTCPDGYTLNGSVCVANHICPSGTYLDTATDICGFAKYVWKETYFDGFGRAFKTRIEGPDGKVITAQSVMNSKGLLEKSSIPYFEEIETPRWKNYIYDPIGRVTQITNTDGTTVKSSYMQGRITLIDANGHVKVEERDIYARLVKVEEYTGVYPSVNLYATTTYEYDILGNLLKTTDTKGNQTTLTYDTFGRKTAMTDPDMGHWQYTYDANGNLASQTDAKGQTITFTYDALNRIKTKHYPTGQDVVYTYDETTSTNSLGKLTTVTDATGQEKYYYDQLGRTKFIKTIDGIQYTTETTYDSLGRTTSIKYPDGETITYSYDQAGNLVQVPGYVTYSNFNALGQASLVTYANGVTTQYQYNTTNNRLYSITTNSPVSGGLQNLSYTYDNTGNITTITDIMDNTKTQNFTYDDINRLTQAQSASYGTLTYNYDQIGNMTYNSQMGSYVYGTKPHAVIQAGTNTYTYDANGNMTTRPGQTITYDYDNKPIAINGTTFVYDYSGSRIKKNNTIYLGKGYECTNGDCTKYIFAGKNRIASKTATTTYYYHPDHLGSSSIITDSTGAKTEETYYYPYGGTRQHTGSTNLKHKYTGQEEDPETGLYYYGARYYDPQLGRFISADTIVPDPSNPQELNRYSYVGNNPLIYTDPTGHVKFRHIAGVIVRVGFAAAGQAGWGEIIGAAIDAINAVKDSENFGDFMITVGFSYCYGSFSSAMGASATISIAGSLEGAIIRSGVSSAMSSAALSSYKGGNPVKAAYTGAAWGMASGALMWAARAYYTEKCIGKMKFNEHTESEINQIKKQLRIVGQSLEGQKVMAKLSSQDIEIEVLRAGRQGPTAYIYEGKYYLAFDGIIPTGEGSAGEELATKGNWGPTTITNPTVALIHELGHLVGTQDPYLNIRSENPPPNPKYSPNNSSLTVENRFRAWSALPQRGFYGTPGDLPEGNWWQKLKNGIW